MTLIVSGDAVFKASVTGALNEICPCSMYTIDSAGTVGASPGNGFCTCYCDHTAGCNLTKSLGDSGVTFTIFVSLGAGMYNHDLDRVFWSPDHVGFDLDDKGGTTTLPSVLLAHELAHAIADLQKLDANDENFAVRGENQVRDELGLPLRIEWSTDPVPNHNEPVLDTTDTESCGCDSMTMTLRRWVLWVIRRAGFPWRGKNRPIPPEIAKERHVRVPGPTPPFDDALSRVDPYIVRQYERALRTRERAEHLPFVRTLGARFDSAQFGVLLETVGIVAEYRVIWIAIEDNAISIVTNLVLNEMPARPFAGRLGPLVEYSLPFNDILDRPAANLSRLPFEDGVGGDVATSDGAVDFLWVKNPNRTRHTALYGYTYEAYHGAWVPPSDANDLARWNAITEAYAFWRELMRTPPMTVRVLAPAATTH